MVEIGVELMDHVSLITVQLHQLVDRWREGDRGAADELLHGIGRRLERLARAMLRSYPNVQRWTDLDDILQNSTLRLLRTLKHLRPTSVREFYGLASLHVRRELLDLARHYDGPEGVGANHASVDPHAVHPVDANDAKETHLEELEIWSAFHQAVEQLPDDDKEVVSLVFYHGWDQLQIAEQLQISSRTVRRRWQAACLRLRDAIGADLPVP